MNQEGTQSIRLPYENEPRKLNDAQARIVRDWMKSRQPYETLPSQVEREIEKAR